MGGVVKAVSNVVSKVVDFGVKTVEKVADFGVNVVEGTLKNVVGVVEGAVTGDWDKFKDSLIGTVQTSLYVTAAVAGAVSGQFYITAAAVVALDGQHNKGQLTAHAVSTVGKFEREIFGSKNILDNLELISTAIIIGSSLYAGYKGFEVISKLSSIESIFSRFSTVADYFRLGSSTYSIYDAYEQWKDALGLYDNLMADYQKWLNQANFEAKRFNQMWDAVYGDMGVWYESMPGGYLFNAGVGSDEYSISSINEQCTYALALDTKRDLDFDRYFTNPFEIDYENLGLEDIKPDVLKYN